MDMDNLGPGPDLESIDFSKLDLGNSLEEPKAEEPKAEEPKAEEPKAEEPKEEPARDEKTGKFKKRDVPDHIPKQRFDEAVGKEREAREAAERRAADLESQLRDREYEEKQSLQRTEQVAELDKKLDVLEAQRDAALLDGEKEKAATLSKEIRDLNRQVAKLEAQEESTAVVSQQLENQRLQTAIAKWEATYPELNPQSENYDKDLIEMILPMQHAMVNSGIPPSQALNTAVTKVMGRMRPSEEKVDETVDEDGLAKAKAEAEAKQKAEERTKAALDKALKTQESQPAQLQSLGADSDTAGEKKLPDVSTMTSEEYDALPETTKARLRGDLL